jgi:hypothetical protein
MEKVICVYDGSYLCNLKNDDLLFTNCIKSLRKHSSCEIIIYKTSNVNIEGLKHINNITFINFNKNNWEKEKMLARFKMVNNHKWDLNDKVIVCDVDMFFLDNPFKIFENTFDFFYTTRSDIKTSPDPINGGMTGFVYSSKINKLYNYSIEQILQPTWDKLKEKKNLFNRDFMCDQKFLCALYQNNNNLPEKINDITFFDATCRWNYTTVKDNFYDIYDRIKNKDVGVVHLKGPILKQRKYVTEYLKILNID